MPTSCSPWAWTKPATSARREPGRCRDRACGRISRKRAGCRPSWAGDFEIPEPRRRLLQVELHGEREVDAHRPTVQQAGLNRHCFTASRRPRSIPSGATSGRVAGSPVRRADDGLDDDVALDPRPPRALGVERLHALEGLRLDHVADHAVDLDSPLPHHRESRAGRRSERRRAIRRADPWERRTARRPGVRSHSRRCSTALRRRLGDLVGNADRLHRLDGELDFLLRLDPCPAGGGGGAAGGGGSGGELRKATGIGGSAIGSIVQYWPTAMPARISP